MRRTRKRRASTSGLVSRGSATTSCIGANRDLAGIVHPQVSRPLPSDKPPVPPIVLKEVYEQRFDETDQAAKEAIWRELGRYLQRYIVPGARVVDIACDLGYFIRNVKAADRWATDIRDMKQALPADVHFVRANGLDLAEVMPNDHFNLAFSTTSLEPLPPTPALLPHLRFTF